MSDSSSLPKSSDPASSGRYVVIARRYRPQSFEDLVGQEHVARALQQAISSDRVGHAYLFTGARGVGKTSAARILAKALNCVQGPTPTPCNECDVCLRVASGDDVDVLEIDGASNRGIDEIRQLRQNVAVRPSRVRFKIYIIDEVHMLTKEAFNALLKTLEEPPEHVKFIFATTEPQKIPITILSRCQRFDFAGISAGSIQERLAQIATAEGVEVDREALQILASRAAGSMRDSQSLLEQLLAVGHKKITAADVNSLIGIAPAERLTALVQHLVNRDAAAALAELDATIAGGVEIGLLLDQLVGYFRDAMTAAVGCSPDQLLYALPSQADEVGQVAKQLGLSTILAISQILDHTAARMRISMHGRTLVEMAVVRICQLGELDDLAALIAEIRGTIGSPSRGGHETTASAARPAAPANTPAKKNADPPAAAALPPNGLANAYRQIDQSRIPPAYPQEVNISLHSPGATGSASVSGNVNAVLPEEVNTQSPTSLDHNSQAITRCDPPHASNPTEEPERLLENNAPAVNSVLAQYQRAMVQGVIPRPVATQSRPSRREQAAKAAEHPFVRRAMELFEAPPDKLRYTPTEERSSGVEQ
jgi:DNA polymerase-3 subunit gamma/tau